MSEYKRNERGVFMGMISNIKNAGSAFYEGGLIRTKTKPLSADANIEQVKAGIDTLQNVSGKMMLAGALIMMSALAHGDVWRRWE